MEGEYYKIDLSAQPEGTVNYQVWDENGDYDYAENINFGMSWDADYLYTYISFEAYYAYSDTVFDACCVQFSGTDYGAVGEDPRLEYGITFNTIDNCNRTAQWYDWLESGYANGGNTEDFEVFIRDGIVTYEMRTPFTAFTTATPEENAKMGVTYVIGNGQGEGRRVQTQIGWGCAESKAAEKHCAITLTAAEPIPERTGEPYYILFHNIGNGQKNQDYFNYYENTADYDSGLCSWQWEATDEKAASAYAGDLLKTLPEDKRAELTNVPGHDFVGFRLAYYSAVDGIWSEQYSMNLYGADAVVSLDDVKEYTFYDGYNYCIMFSAVYEPHRYTIKFNNIGNVDSGESENFWTCRWKGDLSYGENLKDIFPRKEDFSDLMRTTGYHFVHWRVLDFSKAWETIENDMRFYSGYTLLYEGGEHALDENLTKYAVTPEEGADDQENFPYITLRAVYEPDDITVRFYDDDGLTLLASSVQHIGDDLRSLFPDTPTQDYGTFTEWFLQRNGWEQSYTMTYDEDECILTAELLENVGLDTDDDGIIDTIELTATYEITSTDEFRMSANIPLGEDGLGGVAWDLDWNGVLYVRAASGMETAGIPNYSEEADGTTPPWYAYRNYVRELNIDASITSIGEYAFMELKHLTCIIIPNVKLVGRGAFANCGYTGTLSIAAEQIEYDAFYNVHADNVWITGDVKAIAEGAFTNCYTHGFDVEGRNETYYVEEGCLYARTEDGSTFMAYPKWADEDRGTAYVPEGVTRIGECAFAEANQLTTISLPSTLKTIGKAAFANSKSILELHIPESVTLIEDWAFEGLISMEKLYFHGDVPTIQGQNTWAGYPDAWKEPMTIYYLEGKAGWTAGTWDDPSTAEEEAYPTAAFHATDDWVTGEVDGIQWRITYDGKLYVTTEGTDMYQIENIVRPWMPYISYVRELYFGDNITYIGAWTFDGMTHVTTLALPKHLKEIGDGAFMGNAHTDEKRVGHLVLPGELETLGEQVFWHLGITKVTIPNTLKDVTANNPFAGNPIEAYVVAGGTNFRVDEEGILYQLDENGNYMMLVAYPSALELTSYTIQNGTKYLAAQAIQRAYTLGKIVIPNTVEVIYEEAISLNDLPSLTIPASVKEIHGDAFMHNGLSSIIFEGDSRPMYYTTENPIDLFYNNGQYFTIYYYEGATGWDVFQEYRIHMLKAGELPNVAQGELYGLDISWKLDINGKLTVSGTGAIPDNFPHYNWRFLGDKYPVVKEIEIGEGITYVGYAMFFGYKNVTKLTLPTTLTGIGGYAFANEPENGQLSEVELPEGLKTIGEHAFHRAVLTTVTLPSTIEVIENCAFSRTPITEFVLANGNENYTVVEGVLFEKREHEDEEGNAKGGYFYRLHSYPAGSSRTTYSIPTEIQDMEVGDVAAWAFTDANNLTKLNLSNIWGIDTGGILNCNNLTSLELPYMWWINPEAIYGNTKLTSITFTSRIPAFFTWDDGYNMPFVANGANGQNDDLVVYYHANAENVESLNDLKGKYHFAVLNRSDVKGDVSGDGKVGADDLQALVDYFSGKDAGFFDDTNADIDGDKVFTRKDVMIIARYLAGWEDYADYFKE